MSAPLFIPMPGNEARAATLAARAGGAVAALDLHTFPDGEVRPRLMHDVSGHSVALVCTLDHPNEKFLPLVLTAAAAREQGARRIGLVAPYLAYMRQDKRFHPGEAVTSRTFAALISDTFDWMATVDPHLHRTRSLGEIYSIPAVALHAGPALASWIGTNIPRPFLIGPDEESRQWVAEVARQCAAPFAILNKARLSDTEIRIAAGGLEFPPDARPVLLDDIVASGGTMLETLRLIRLLSQNPPVVVAIHGLLSEAASRAIHEAGARLVTTTTVPGAAAIIEVDEFIAPCVMALMQ